MLSKWIKIEILLIAKINDVDKHHKSIDRLLVIELNNRIEQLKRNQNKLVKYKMNPDIEFV
jgi:hypothetical protein